MLQKFRKLNSGSSLIEVLVAVLVVGLVITAVMLSITYSVKNSSEARYREVASQLAQDAMEVVVLRREVDSWTTFFDKNVGTTYCISTASINASPGGSCTPVTFGSKNYNRTVRFSDKVNPANPADPQSITATVTVQWNSDSNVSQDVVIVQKFYERAI